MTETRKRIVLLVASLLLSVGAIEVGVRLIEPREVLREYFEMSDPVLNHRFVPNARGRQKTLEFDAAYTMNALGLRDVDFPVAKPAGTRRLLMLGDSFTEGLGVQNDETFSHVLGQMLRKSDGHASWQVINAGVASYSPMLEYLYMKHGGLDLSPDLVILNLDLSDFYDDIQYRKGAVFDEGGELLAVPGKAEEEMSARFGQAVVGVKNLLKYHTQSYNFVKRRLAVYLESGRERTYSDDIRIDKYGLLRGEESSMTDRDWTLTYEYLLKIRDLVQQRGADFWIAVYPYGLQISEREWINGRQVWGFEAGRTYTGRPQQLVEAFGAKHGIPVVNLHDAFARAATSTYPMYFAWDGHWQPAGHKVAAQGLYDALQPYLAGQRPAVATTAP